MQTSRSKRLAVTLKKKEQKDFSLTAESHDTSWTDVVTDSSKILCLCKHIANIKLKALVITIHENKAEMSFHAPLVRRQQHPETEIVENYFAQIGTNCGNAF